MGNIDLFFARSLVADALQKGNIFQSSVSGELLAGTTNTIAMTFGTKPAFLLAASVSSDPAKSIFITEIFEDSIVSGGTVIPATSINRTTPGVFSGQVMNAVAVTDPKTFLLKTTVFPGQIKSLVPLGAGTILIFKPNTTSILRATAGAAAGSFFVEWVWAEVDVI